MDTGREKKEAPEGKEDSGGDAAEDKKAEETQELSLIQVATDSSVQDAIDHAQQTNSCPAFESPTTALSTVDKLVDASDATRSPDQAAESTVLARGSTEKDSCSYGLGQGGTCASKEQGDALQGSGEQKGLGEIDNKTVEEPKDDDMSPSIVHQQAFPVESSSSLESGVVEEATGSQAETKSPCYVILPSEKTHDMSDNKDNVLACSVGDLDMLSGTRTADYEQQCNTVLPEETDCSDHSSEKTSVYCENCEKKICIRCVMGDHRLHNFMPFQDKIKKQHNELSQALSVVNDLLSTVTDLDGKLQTSKEGVFETASQLKDEILKEKGRSLEKLQQQFETEMTKLEVAHNSRKDALEQVCETKLKAINDHVTHEVAAADKRLADGRTTREDAGNHEQTTKDAQPGMSLGELQSSTVDTKREITGLIQTENSLIVLPITPTSENTEVKQHGELGAKLIVGFTKESEVQTDKTGAIKELEGQRERIRSLTQKTPEELHKEKKNGYVAITPQSWKACQQYGAGNGKDPLPLEAPDVKKPLTYAASDILYLPPKEAVELALIVGGGSDITRGWFQRNTALKQNATPVSIYVFLVDKSEYPTEVKAKNKSGFRGYNLLLPINDGLKYSLKVAMNWPDDWDVTVTAWPHGDVLDNKVTVENWAETYGNLYVLFEIEKICSSSDSC